MNIQNGHTRRGYILVMALLMIALAVLMTSIMFDRGGSYVPYIKTVADRQKAEMIALGGLALAQGQLAREYVPSKNSTSPRTKEGAQAAPQAQAPQQGQQKQQQKADPEDETKQLLKTILPTLNRWQTFVLNEDVDGVDGTLQICLMSEDGKINLNKVYDFEQKKFVGDTKQAAQQQATPQVQAPQQAQQQKAAQMPQKQGSANWKKLLEIVFERIEKQTKSKELLKNLEQFLQKRGYPLNDVTELLTIKAFESFKNDQYYQPPQEQQQKKAETKQPLALTDLFTLTSDTPTIDPWLLSDSMLGVLGIPRAVAGDVQKRTQQVDEWLKEFKIQASWQKDWDTRFKTMYGVAFKSLPKESEPMFTNKCEPRYFSVLVHSKIGDATQHLYAILERNRKTQDTKTVYDVKIRKYYWL